MKLLSPFLRTEARKYALAGVLFGFAFPILATLLRIAESGPPFGLQNILEVQITDRLLWIIDTAPFFLGLIASFAGRRQDNLLQLNRQLKQRELEMEQVYSSIEQRIKERTAQLEQRAAQQDAISFVARSITSIQNMDELLPAITQLASERFGYYHIGIFLLDDENDFVVLRATNSEGGRNMLSRQHKLKVDVTSIVGYAATRREPRIALDVGTDAVFLNNPDLPDTRSEMALPLSIGRRVIGVLDIQSTLPNAFTTTDVATLGILADQIAMAIENASLFSQATKALRESEETFGRYVRQEWEDFAGQVKNTGYVFDGTRTIALEKKDRREKAKTLSQTGRLSLEKETAELAIPIRLRGQTIGILDVRSKKGARQWTRDEIILLESAAERAALALENARLVESAQRRASRERAIGEISSKIGAVSDFEAILQTAVEELGRRIGSAAEVVLELETKDTQE